MKSKLLSKFDLSREESFEEDLQVLLRLSKKSLRAIPEFALQVRASVTGSDIARTYDKTAEALKTPRSTIEHALDVCTFFLQEFCPGGKAEADEPEDLAADLSEIFDLPPGKKQMLGQLLASLKAMAKEKSGLIAAARAQVKGILPRLSSFSATADLRAVFTREYDGEDDVDDYVPQCIGAVPVGIVRLRLSKGVPDEVCFQVTPQFLETIISGLRALEKELQSASKRFDIGIKE